MLMLKRKKLYFDNNLTSKLLVISLEIVFVVLLKDEASSSCTLSQSPVCQPLVDIYIHFRYIRDEDLR